MSPFSKEVSPISIVPEVAWHWKVSELREGTAKWPLVKVVLAAVALMVEALKEPLVREISILGASRVPNLVSPEVISTLILSLAWRCSASTWPEVNPMFRFLMLVGLKVTVKCFALVKTP